MTAPSIQSPESPKYWQMITELRRQIAQGELAPGDRLASLADAQRQFGASRSTVNKVHAMLEQEGLVVREQGKGTFVASQPEKDLPRRKGLVGFSGADFLLSGSSSYWVKLLEGVWAPLSNSDTVRTSQLLLFNSLSSNDIHSVDGLLLNSTRSSLMEIPQSMPCVSLLAVDPVQDVSSVVADDYAGARELTRHLLQLGHRRIAYMCSGTCGDPTLRRLAGYRDALREHGITPDLSWIYRWKSAPAVDFTRTGHISMQQWLNQGWRELGCTALLAQNDEAAIGAMGALAEAGIRVPQDISVVGFDGIEQSEYSSPGLTTMEVPLREMGRLAMEMLLRQIETGDTSVEHVTLPTTLRVRQSTAPPGRNN